MPRTRLVIATALLALVGTTSAKRASAYCRSTTCDTTTESCTTDENGCPRGGAPLSWRALPLTYRFSKAGSDKLDMSRARQVIRRAFDTWEDVTCNGKRTSLRFKEGPDITSDKPLTRKARANEPFGIYFRDASWPYDDGEESLAITSQTFGVYSGYIDYADIEINTSERTYAVEDEEEGIDLQAVVTHEIGHYIGLAHSNVPDSIMVARYCQSGDRCGRDLSKARALADDDIAAVCALYPPGGIAGVTYEPEAPACNVAAVGASGASGRSAQRSAQPVALSAAVIGAIMIGVLRRIASRGSARRGRRRAEG